MKRETIQDAIGVLFNELEFMNTELSTSKAPIEIMQLKQKRIDRLRIVYSTISRYKYLNVFDEMEEIMYRLQQLDSRIDGFLVEIKFTDKAKNAAMFSVRATNMVNLFNY